MVCPFSSYKRTYIQTHNFKICFKNVSSKAWVKTDTTDSKFAVKAVIKFRFRKTWNGAFLGKVSDCHLLEYQSVPWNKSAQLIRCCNCLLACGPHVT
jgi:hypothetical protein